VAESGKLNMGIERAGNALILLIENDKDTQGYLRSTLGKLGYGVLAVESDKEALVLTLREGAKPDLIIIDMNATADQILEAGRNVRAFSDLSPSVPIIVIPFAFDPALEGTDVPAGENIHICYWAKPDQLGYLVGRLLG
jgi:CheY-like chemotaxis protein